MDLNKVVSALGSSGFLGGFAGGAAGGALTSALMGKKGGKHAKTLLKAGGLAAVGGLAWKAYQSYQQTQSGGQQSQPGGANQGAAVAREADFRIPTGDASAGSRGLLLVRAMIVAANADGHLDEVERRRILSRVESLQLDADEKSLVVSELLHPGTMDEVIGAVRDQTEAIEVYAASLLAVDETRREAKAYLSTLAVRLGLPTILVEGLSDEHSMARHRESRSVDIGKTEYSEECSAGTMRAVSTQSRGNQHVVG